MLNKNDELTGDEPDIIHPYGWRTLLAELSPYLFRKILLKTPSSSNQVTRQSTGISKRLLKVFVLQMAFISGVTILGVYAAAWVVEGVMMRAALQDEADYFWDLYEENEHHPLPNTNNLIGYLFTPNTSQPGLIPANVVQLEAGFGRVTLDNKQPLVWVEDKYGKRLVLIFDEQSVTRLSFYFGVVPLSLVLIVIYFSAWLAFRQSRKLLSPLMRLASLIRSTEPEAEIQDTLELSNRLKTLKSTYGDDEVDTLIDALTHYNKQIVEFIERERRFTRDASHELRTPLSVIQGSVEGLLGSDTLTPRELKAAKRIHRTVINMGELVRTFLLLARAQNDPLEPNQTFNVNAVVNEVIEQVQQQKAKESRYPIIFSEHQDLTISGSKQILTVVIGNLVRNALTYGSQENIEAQINANRFIISNGLKDHTGIDIEKLFEPFYREKPQAQSPGYGVGLDIVKRLCDIAGWSIETYYDDDHGLVFSIDFTHSVKTDSAATH